MNPILKLKVYLNIKVTLNPILRWLCPEKLRDEPGINEELINEAMEKK